MTRITVELIRKRAEHNEGIIATLQELSLHQQNIEKIELLGQLCRHLQILYLQNNLISRLENLRRLKELQYLNLAVNNISKIENLEGCESLAKLDLTLNFIAKPGLLSIERLQHNTNLRELYLIGNPCLDIEGSKNFIIASIPSLERLDGKDVLRSDRIVALQRVASIRARLVDELSREGWKIENLVSVRKTNPDEDPDEDDEEDDDAPRFNDKGERVRKYSRATRMAEYREMEKQRLEEEQKKKSNFTSLEGDVRNVKKRTGFDPLPEGRVYQKNEGSWDFVLKESDDGSAWLLNVPVGKFLESSLIDVDIQPRIVRVLVKGKLLQLNLTDEVNIEKSTAQRSMTTGHLLISMPKLDFKDILKTSKAEPEKNAKASAPIASLTKGPRAPLIRLPPNQGLGHMPSVQQSEAVSVGDENFIICESKVNPSPLDAHADLDHNNSHENGGGLTQRVDHNNSHENGGGLTRRVDHNNSHENGGGLTSSRSSMSSSSANNGVCDIDLDDDDDVPPLE